MGKSKQIKSDGTLDKRTGQGRGAAGKLRKPKGTEQKMKMGLKNNKKDGKTPK